MSRKSSVNFVRCGFQNESDIQVALMSTHDWGHKAECPKCERVFVKKVISNGIFETYTLSKFQNLMCQYFQ